MKKVLITGASGFIGSHLCQLLLTQGFTVAGTCHQKSMWFKHPRLQVIKSDLSQTGILDVLSSFEPDYLVHTAAINPSVIQGDNRSEFNYFNHEVTMKLANQFLEFNELHKLPAQLPKKFINLSTYEIYGEAVESQGHDEQAGLNPMTAYASSKAKTHHAIEQLNPDQSRFVNVVCSNNYGPYQRHEKLIPAIVSKLIRDQVIDVYGDGSSQRTWTHVNDTVSGLMAALNQRTNNRYHLCSDEQFSVLDVVTMAHKILLKLGVVETLKPEIKWHSSDLNPVFKMQCEWTKKQLQWQPQIKFIAGLESTIKHLIGVKDESLGHINHH